MFSHTPTLFAVRLSSKGAPLPTPEEGRADGRFFSREATSWAVSVLSAEPKKNPKTTDFLHILLGIFYHFNASPGLQGASVTLPSQALVKIWEGALVCGYFLPYGHALKTFHKFGHQRGLTLFCFGDEKNETQCDKLYKS